MHCLTSASAFTPYRCGLQLSINEEGNEVNHPDTAVNGIAYEIFIMTKWSYC